MVCRSLRSSKLIISAFIYDTQLHTSTMASSVFQKLSFRTCSTKRACIFPVNDRMPWPPRKHENSGFFDNVDDDPIISDLRESQQQKHTPLVSALKAKAEKNVARFHFPGHNRGRAAPSSFDGVQPYLHDLPGIPEIDSLSQPKGPILDAQKLAAELFGATETWFLVGGTTCGVQASVMATCSPGDTLILPRNSHVSAFSSMVLSGAIPEYIIPDYDSFWDIASGVTPSQVETAIKEANAKGRKPSAVLVTSPTYHGLCSNLEGISSLCQYHDIPFIVDEAHGAHFKFHESFPLSALHQGADLSVQSTHKVLCSLSQSSMLHMSGKIVNRERICRCLQTLQSTSASILLLASLDAARAQISEHRETIFNEAVETAMEAKARIEKIPGLTFLDEFIFPDLVGKDPLRITVGFSKLGVTGFEAEDILCKDYGVIAELTGTRSVTFAINLGTSRDDILRLVSGLTHISQKHYSIRVEEERDERPYDIHPFIATSSRMRLSPRDAFFASKRKVCFKESVGKVSGELICPYPPGIPVLVPGEVITEEASSYLAEVKKKGGLITGAADPTLSSIVCI